MLEQSKLKAASSAWMAYWLWAAAAYNLAWGAVVVIAPNLLFDLFGMDRPAYPGIWQCVGMIVGVYGIGYAIAATNPLVHWPIVLVGLLGKIFGPIGFVGAVATGEFPLQFGVTILTNDLVWWIPFALILRRAYLVRQDAVFGAHEADFANVLNSTQDTLGRSLAVLAKRPTLIVFLRHFGCTFCREALADLQLQRREIESSGRQIAVVYMSSSDDGDKFLTRYDLTDIIQISDPTRRLYRAFALKRGNPWQLFGPAVFWRGFAAFWSGHGIGGLQGDGLQMPGAFLLQDGKIVRTFRHKHAGDRPDYRTLACGAGGCQPVDASNAAPAG